MKTQQVRKPGIEASFLCSLVEKCDENHEKCIFCKSKLFSVRLFGDY